MGTRKRSSAYTMGRRPASSGQPLHTCRECAESYDWHSMSVKGEPILCRCRWYKEGKFCVFLKDPECEHFKLRQTEDSHAEDNSQQA